MEKALIVEVTEEGVLSITIGIDTLAKVMQTSTTDGIGTYDDEEDEYFGLNIEDTREFAKELICEISKEDEIGDTPLYQFLDKCVIDGLDSGTFLSVDIENPINHNDVEE